MDAKPQTYNISVSVTYVGGGQGTSTLTVTSALPKFTTDVVQPGNLTVTQAIVKSNGQEFPSFIRIGEQTSAAATQIRATTGPDDSNSMAGDYMWMQLIYFNSTINQNVNNAAVQHTKQTMGLVIDDGDAGARLNLGQPLTEGGNMWVSASIGESPNPTTGTFIDQPHLDNNWAPGTQKALLDQGLTYTANFETYLMYHPQDGVWIALQEYTWSIDIGATNANFGQGNATLWAGNPDPTQPNPQATTPAGSDAFPTWTNESFGTPWTPPFPSP